MHDFLTWDEDRPGKARDRLRVVYLDPATAPTMGPAPEGHDAPNRRNESPLGPCYTWFSPVAELEQAVVEWLEALPQRPSFLVQEIDANDAGPEYPYGMIHRYRQAPYGETWETLTLEEWLDRGGLDEQVWTVSDPEPTEAPRRRPKRKIRRQAFPPHPLDEAVRTLKKSRSLLVNSAGGGPLLSATERARVLARVQYARGALNAYVTMDKNQRRDKRDRRTTELFSGLLALAPALLETFGPKQGPTPTPAAAPPSITCRPCTITLDTPHLEYNVGGPGAWTCCACWQHRRSMTINPALRKECNLCGHERCDTGPWRYAEPNEPSDHATRAGVVEADLDELTVERYVVSLNRAYQCGLTALDTSALLSPVTPHNLYAALATIPYEEFCGKIQGMVPTDDPAGETLASTKGTLWLRAFYVQVIQPFQAQQRAERVGGDPA